MGKTKIISLLQVSIAIAFTFMISSCSDCIEGNGKIAKREMSMPEINSVNLSISADVILVDDSTGTVTIEGESNLIEVIVLERNGKTLTIKSDNCLSSNKSITIYVPIQVVASLQVNGSGNFKSEDKLAATDLELGINGSGNIDIEVDAGNVSSEINGSGDIILKGASKSHKIEVNGSGNIEAENFPTGDIRILINGSGDCKVMATTALALKIRGSGSVYYSGNPDISSDIKGSGSVEKIK